jgi:hypothetical protein
MRTSLAGFHLDETSHRDSISNGLHLTIGRGMFRDGPMAEF